MTDRAEMRKVLIDRTGPFTGAVDVGTYAVIVADMRAAGLKPASLSFRNSERGSGYGRTSSGYDTSSRPVGLDDPGPSGYGAPAIRATAAGAATPAGPRSAADCQAPATGTGASSISHIAKMLHF